MLRTLSPTFHPPLSRDRLHLCLYLNTQHGKGVGQVDLVDAQSAPRAAVQPPGEAWVRQEAGRRGAQHVRLEHRSRRRDDTGGWNFLKMISTNELSSI